MVARAPGGHGGPMTPVHRTLDDGLAVLAVLVILGVLLPASWFAMVVVLVAMGAPALVAARFRER
jgi:hypothetical protein